MVETSINRLTAEPKVTMVKTLAVKDAVTYYFVHDNDKDGTAFTVNLVKDGAKGVLHDIPIRIFQRIECLNKDKIKHRFILAHVVPAKPLTKEPEDEKLR